MFSVDNIGTPPIIGQRFLLANTEAGQRYGHPLACYARPGDEISVLSIEQFEERGIRRRYIVHFDFLESAAHSTTWCSLKHSQEDWKFHTIFKPRVNLEEDA